MRATPGRRNPRPQERLQPHRSARAGSKANIRRQAVKQLHRDIANAEVGNETGVPF
jgi:hypothetical protein